MRAEIARTYADLMAADEVDAASTLRYAPQSERQLFARRCRNQLLNGETETDSSVDVVDADGGSE